MALAKVEHSEHSLRRRATSSRPRRGVGSEPDAWYNRPITMAQPDPTSSPGEVTRLLQAWADGDAAALEILTPIVYAELHRIAISNLAREGDPRHLL